MHWSKFQTLFQMAAVSVIPCVLDFFNDDIVRQEILPKTRKVYEQNGGDVKIVLAVLACVSKILDKLDKTAIIDEVLPLLLEVKLQDVNVLVRVLGKLLETVAKKMRLGLWLWFKINFYSIFVLHMFTIDKTRTLED